MLKKKKIAKKKPKTLNQFSGAKPTRKKKAKFQKFVVKKGQTGNNPDNYVMKNGRNFSE